MPRRLAPILVACLIAAAPASADQRVSASSSGARADARETLRDARALLDGRGVETGKELSPVLKDLAVRLKALPDGEEREARRILLRPTRGESQPGEEAYQAGTTEHTLCSAHFCIHWVSGDTRNADEHDMPPPADADADGVPDFVQTMSQVFENVHAVENVQMGWREPRSDGTRGGDNGKVDVYLKQLGNQGIFGYATPDPGQETNSQAAYLVVDNDFRPDEYPRYSNPLLPMQVTAAHEYNHVLQFGYDVLQDSWMFESTAVWMEDKVYDDINDYVSYLKAWTQLTQIPLTTFNANDLSDLLNLKVYGDAVWNRWIDEHYGAETIRRAWEKSLETVPRSFGPNAYDAALRTVGTSFFDAFTSFAADTAEWQSTAGPFEEGSTWPEVQRASRTSLAPGGLGVEGRLDHTSFALTQVTPTMDERIKLVASLPRGAAGAFALVGREGDEATGRPTVVLKRLPSGGQTSVDLPNPNRFSRITAVLINGDATQKGFSQFIGDWLFAADDQAVRAHVSNDYSPPSVRKRSPKVGATVSTKASVVVTFSEPMTNITKNTVQLIAPGGKKVSVTLTNDPVKRRVTLKPKRRLDPRRRYLVKIGSTVVDDGDNRLRSRERNWRFSTGRK